MASCASASTPWSDTKNSRKALTDVSNLVRPSEDVFYQELAEKRATVKRFLPILLRVIRFDSNAAARPLLEALQWLHERPDHDPPIAIVDKPWQRHVLRQDGRINERAFTFCTLDKLRVPSGVAMSS